MSKAEGNGTEVAQVAQVAPEADTAFLALPKASAASAAASPSTNRLAELRGRAKSLDWDPDALRAFLADLVDALDGF